MRVLWTCLLAGEAQKVQYTLDQIARGGAGYFDLPELEEDVGESLAWQAEKSDLEIIAAREEMLASLEWASVQQQESGMLEEWWSCADEGIRQVSGCVLFPLRVSLSG